MATAGPNSCATGADDAGVGTVIWSSPGNISTSDNVRATAALLIVGISTHYLVGTNCSFNIPAGSTIKGITVGIERSNTAGGNCEDNRVRIVKGGVIGTTEKAAVGNWPLTDAYINYGSATDLWGLTWTADDINATNFGVAISARGVEPEVQSTAAVDHIRITVDYTIPPVMEEYIVSNLSRWMSAPPPLPSYGAFTESDEVGASLLNYYSEQEDFWVPSASLIPRTISPPDYGYSVQSDEIGSSLLEFHLEQEEPKYLPSSDLDITQRIPWDSTVFSYDEMGSPLLNYYSEQEDFWVPSTSLIPRTISPPIYPPPATDDEISWPLAGLFLKDYEDGLFSELILPLPGYLAQLNSCPTAFIDTEEIRGSTNFDQEDLYVTTEQTISWCNIRFLDDEIFYPAANFYTEQEDDYSTYDGGATIRLQQSIPWVMSAYLTNTQVFTDDEKKSSMFVESEEPNYDTFAVQYLDRSLPFQYSPLGEEVGAGLSLFPRELEEPNLLGGLISATETLTWNASSFISDEIGAGLLFFSRELEEPWAASYQVICWTAQTTTDDEAKFWVGLDQEEPYVSQVQVIPWYSLPFSYDEDRPRAMLVEELYPALNNAVYTIGSFSSSLVVYPDEIGSPLANIIIAQEELWSVIYQPVAQVVKYLVYAKAFLYDEPLYSAGNFPRDSEDNYIPLVQNIPWISHSLGITQPIVDEEPTSAFLRFLLSQEEPHVSLFTSTVWTPRVTTDDEASSLLKYFYTENEEPLVAQCQSIMWIAISSLDDEVVGLPKGFSSDQLDFFQPLSTIIVWYPLVFVDDESKSGVYVSQEESIGSIYQAPLGPSNQVVIRFANICSPSTFDLDEIGSSLLAFRLDQEDDYTRNTQSIVWISVSFTYTEIVGEEPKVGFVEQEDDYNKLVQSLNWRLSADLIASSPFYYDEIQYTTVGIPGIIFIEPSRFTTVLEPSPRTYL